VDTLIVIARWHMQMRACAVRRSRDLSSLRCGTTLGNDSLHHILATALFRSSNKQHRRGWMVTIPWWPCPASCATLRTCRGGERRGSISVHRTHDRIPLPRAESARAEGECSDRRGWSGNQLHLIVTANTLRDHTALLSLQSTRVRMYGQGHTRRGRTMGADLGESAGVGACGCACDAQRCFFIQPFSYIEPTCRHTAQHCVECPRCR
jgi:hypothetical protein